MAKDPAYTYRGALKILGKHDRPWLAKLDKALGGIILASPAAGLIDPETALLALWGWVDQKNEAMTQLQRVLDSSADLSGYERHELIAAAHTTLVVSAFFEVLREQVGEQNFRALKLSRSEQEHLITGEVRSAAEDAIARLYRAAVPAPSTTKGFEDNRAAVDTWFEVTAARTREFLRGLSAGTHLADSLYSLPRRARTRYRDHYLRLAADVPEFLVWASFGEYAAIRKQVSTIRQDVLAAFDRQGAALLRLESVLALAARTSGPHGPDPRAVIQRANRGALHELVVPVDSAHQLGWDTNVVFPSIEQIYVNPRYRIDTQYPLLDIQWQKQKVHEDLDLRLAAYVTAPESTGTPLLLLGHPGAGKSTLTKIFAARLPASRFTVVRVPLRRVDAEAPVYEQIQQALTVLTHGRVSWAELAEQSRDTIRVILLDGLDELLQASARPRSGYLQEVAEFQRLEALQDHPVVVLVTSRTTVADRVRVPGGTPVIHLEDFSPDQIRQWLRVWHEINPSTTRALSAEDALRHQDLAEQPLLLLMLALYATDPDSPSLDTGLSRTALYRRLLHNFAQREVSKMDIPADSEEFSEAVRDQLWRLAVAALGMFNRGRQDISETELGADLAALSDTPDRAPAGDLGQRTIAQFFFVHTPEANAHLPGKHQRHYEFLHATFGEYLIASQVFQEIGELAAASGRYSPSDDLLFALLSHQPLATNQSLLDFLREHADETTPEHRARINRMLEKALSGYRQRHGSTRFADYRPLPIDRVRELAAYSANLVLLRVLFEPDSAPVPLNRCWPSTTSLASWESTVDLWKAGLDWTGWQAVVETLKLTGRALALNEHRSGDASPQLTDLNHARLSGASRLEAWLRFGSAVRENIIYASEGDSWQDVVLSGLLASFAHPERMNLLLPDLPEDETSPNARINEVLNLLLLRARWQIPHEMMALLLRWALTCHPVIQLAPHVLAAVAAANPRLLVDIPDLRKPGLYADSAAAVALLRQGEELAAPGEVGLLRALRGSLAPHDSSADLAAVLTELVDFATVESGEPNFTRLFGDQFHSMTTRGSLFTGGRQVSPPPAIP